jgi:hypothetical protein
MRSLYEDLCYAIRVLRGSPGFTAVAVLTLALGIAANATVFGWIDTLLVRPFPGVAGGGRLVALETVSPSGEYSNTSYRDYRDYRDSVKSFSGLAASLLNAFNVGPSDNPRRIYGEYVSGNYFAVLGVKPIGGRAFLPSEYGDSPGAFPAAVIGYRLWRSLFQGDPGVVGRTIRVNRYQLTVAGIAPEEFRGTMPGMRMEIWIPMSMAPLLNGQGGWLLEDRSVRQMWVTARLKPGVALEQANAEVEACARRLAEASPRTSGGFRASLMPVWKAHIGMQSVLLAPLRILMAVCFVVFLIVGANVANLQFARATARRRELSVRMALGASRWRLARQLLTESLLLAAMGALAGIPLAAWLGRSLLWMLPPFGFPVDFDFSLNADMLGFTVLLCCAGSLLTGLAPAVHSVRSDLMEALKEGGRSGTPGAGQNRTRGAAGGFGGGAGAGGAGGHRAVRAELSKRADHLSGLRREPRTVRAIPPRHVLPEPGAEGAVLLPSARPDRGAARDCRGELRELGAAGHRERTAVGHAGGRIRSRPERGNERVERHGGAGLFRHPADSAAGRTRLHRTGRPRSRAGGDRQSDFRAALLRRPQPGGAPGDGGRRVVEGGRSGEGQQILPADGAAHPLYLSAVPPAARQRVLDCFLHPDGGGRRAGSSARSAARRWRSTRTPASRRWWSSKRWWPVRCMRRRWRRRC